ncbi:BZ3500_MvSof-1268-A1-R1_Chr1-3g02464 [Microbotryum saponariae]|uniref:BZ3500_MvSof-1268-A1-R1_Chr1-3g02464 protein n=1 Tax=Microbotryum saponariae TaxID=289078 RepID=A0A2X0KXE5_9BASI|nr:BZ3500_MvSof-1268-A1-R1_Chr1-3g02464 [Microbotryum saponariae]SCZ96304.1 BZ3501_MvSof-1269-A2-R1_Chr1-3g02067 [Microbotryum saponariae]
MYHNSPPGTERTNPLHLVQTGPQPVSSPLYLDLVGILCHPPPKWDHAVRKMKKLLPARWARYFEAWASVTTLNPPELSKSQNLEQWATHGLPSGPLCRRRRFSSDLLETITETDFEGLRASIQESKGRLVSL